MPQYLVEKNKDNYILVSAAKEKVCKIPKEQGEIIEICFEDDRIKELQLNCWRTIRYLLGVFVDFPDATIEPHEAESHKEIIVKPIHYIEQNIESLVTNIHQGDIIATYGNLGRGIETFHEVFVLGTHEKHPIVFEKKGHFGKFGIVPLNQTILDRTEKIAIVPNSIAQEFAKSKQQKIIEEIKFPPKTLTTIERIRYEDKLNYQQKIFDIFNQPKINTDSNIID